MLKILQKLLNQKLLSPSELQLLLDWELTNSYFYQNLTETDARKLINKKSELLLHTYDQVRELCQQFNLTKGDIILNLLWNLWLPLTLEIAQKKAQISKVFCQGILGSQGTGKTTLSNILTLILESMGYQVLSISLDDFYKTYRERQVLQKFDRRLIYRGPPLTHDVNLALDLFNSLERKNTQEILLPRFDKSAYNGRGERAGFIKVKKPNIILFEGWFVGVKPIDPTLFNEPPPPINTPEDQQFAKDNNERLFTYLPLWEKLDSLIILTPQDYRFSLQWRQEAEEKMIAQGKKGMTNQEITDFVNYFWRSLHPELFIKPLMKNGNLVDLVIEINRNHLPEKIYKPSYLS